MTNKPLRAHAASINKNAAERDWAASSASALAYIKQYRDAIKTFAGLDEQMRLIQNLAADLPGLVIWDDVAKRRYYALDDMLLGITTQIKAIMKETTIT